MITISTTSSKLLTNVRDRVRVRADTRARTCIYARIRLPRYTYSYDSDVG